MRGFLNWIPLFQNMKGYSKSDLRGDGIAGITVGILLIPQGMAYAVLAGMPPVYGLFSATVPLVVYGLLGSSRQLAVGPVAIVSLLITSGVSEWAQPGTAEYVSLVVQLSLLTGLIQVIAGAVRLGYLANFLSRPVIHGFSSAAALVIIGSQLGNLLGIPVPRSTPLHETVINLIRNGAHFHWPTFAIGICAVGIVIAAPRIHRAIPGALIAIVAGTLTVYFAGHTMTGVKIVGDIPGGAPPFAIPSFSLESLRMLWPTAVTIAFFGFLESYAVSKALAAKKQNQKLNANHEFISIGAANLAGAFFNAYPVAGGFGRSAVNEQAGAVSGLASLFSAFIVLLCLLFLTPLFRHLPGAVLAAMIVVAVIPLIAIDDVKYLWRSDRRDLFLLITTFAATLALGVESGIVISVVLSLLLVVYSASNPHSAELGKLPGDRHYMNVIRFPKAETCDDILVFRFDGPLFFGNVSVFEDRIKMHMKKKSPQLKLIVLDASAIHHIDSTAMHTLTQMVEGFARQHINVYTAYVRGPIRDTMKRSGLYDIIGSSNHFLNVADAVERFTSRHRKEQSECLSNN